MLVLDLRKLFGMLLMWPLDKQIECIKTGMHWCVVYTLLVVPYMHQQCTHPRTVCQRCPQLLFTASLKQVYWNNRRSLLAACGLMSTCGLTR